MITGINDITPVQKICEYYFKRDDLFMPFDFSPANGSKLRQGILLCEKYADAKNGIFTGTSVHSPQAVICASIAKSIGAPCTIVYGGTDEQHSAHNKYYKICRQLGASVEFTKLGYNAVVEKRARDLANAANGFCVKYGFDLRNNIDIFIGSVADQVQNIPQRLDALVITVGSAITILGVLLGIVKYGKDVRRIIGVGCAPNRYGKICQYADYIKAQTGYKLPVGRISYVDCFNKLAGYKYENTMQESYAGLVFHPRYEAKTFHFLRTYLPKGGDILMWITGHDF